MAGNQGWRRGLRQTGEGYAVLVLAAAVTATLLRLLGVSPLGTGNAYLADSSLVRYWTAFSITGFIVVIVAGIAGSLLVASNRSVLSSGVMVALALVPGATLAASGLVAGEPDVVARGLLRWVIDVVIVAITSLIVLGWKRSRSHHRRSLP